MKVQVENCLKMATGDATMSSLIEIGHIWVNVMILAVRSIFQLRDFKDPKRW